MRDLTSTELGFVYGAGSCGKPTPPSCGSKGSKGKGTKGCGSKGSGSKSCGSKSKGSKAKCHVTKPHCGC